MIYLDTSALLKQLVEEDESTALDAWLRADRGPALTSVLTEVELALAVARRGRLTALAAELLRGLARVEMTPGVRNRAAEAAGRGLRTLDAVHVGTALEVAAAVRQPVTVVTYDVRMQAACADLGLAVAAPTG